MKERGIIFNSEMVRAILDGRKTQTRIPAAFKVREEGYNLNFSGLKPGFYCSGVPSSGFVLRSMGAGRWNDRTYPLHCPYGQAGDVIPLADKDGNIKGEIEIVDVWLQRVQDISQEDAVAEGVAPLHGGYWKHYQPGWTQHQLSARGSFVTLWNSINGVDAWDKNPWVWVIEFRRVIA